MAAYKDCVLQKLTQCDTSSSSLYVPLVSMKKNFIQREARFRYATGPMAAILVSEDAHCVTSTLITKTCLHSKTLMARKIHKQVPIVKSS